MTPQHAKIMSQPNNAPWVSIVCGYISSRPGHYQYLGGFIAAEVWTTVKPMSIERPWGAWVRNFKRVLSKSSFHILKRSTKVGLCTCSNGWSAPHHAADAAFHVSLQCGQGGFTLPSPSSRLELSVYHATLVVVTPSYKHSWKMTHIDRSL